MTNKKSFDGSNYNVIHVAGNIKYFLNVYPLQNVEIEYDCHANAVFIVFHFSAQSWLQQYQQQHAT